MGCVVTKRKEFGPQVSSLPEVCIQVGNKIKQNETLKWTIVFVFGGPGSRKGRVVNDLVQGYGFHVVNAERLILNHLPEKINLEIAIDESQGCFQSTKELEKALLDHPDILTLQWVLDLISRQIHSDRANGYKYCLVDLVPNLRAMLHVRSFIKNCGKEMELFEKEWPSSFALNLTIPEEKLVENLNSLVARNPNQMQKGGQSDEKDIMKTKRRYEEYSASVRHFLHYFRQSGRLASVDVSCGIADLIWSKVSEFFFNLGFEQKTAVNTVVVFSFKTEDISSLDLKKYRMELIHVNNLTSLPDNSLVDVFVALNEYIRKSKATVESFVVDLKDVSVLEDLEQKDGRQIFFLDKDENHLDQYIYIGAKEDDYRKSLFNLPFRAVCTTENEICLFPDDVDIDICKQVALLYAETKEIVKKRITEQENRNL